VMEEGSCLEKTVQEEIKKNGIPLVTGVDG
jgi:hypothetical protein